MVDLKSIDERLAKAREEAEFWERARALLADPRMAQVLKENENTAPAQDAAQSSNGDGASRPRGQVRRKVWESLPQYGVRETAVTTGEIVAQLTAQGYIFEAKKPEVAVNAALVSLEAEQAAQATGKRGKAKLWTKGSRGFGEI
jgi:hypothetical protein